MLVPNPIPLMAQAGMGISDCIEYALEHSPVLANEQMGHDEEAALLRSERSGYLPEINAYMRYQHYFSDLPVYIFPEQEGTIISGGTSEGPYPVQLGLPHNLNAGLTLNQVIFDNNMFLMARFGPEKEKLNAIADEKVQNELMFNIATQFIQVASNRKKLVIIDYNLQRLAKLEAMVTLQVENEFATPSDVHKLKVKAYNLTIERDRLLSGMRIQEDYMKIMMGMAKSDTLALLVKDVELPLLVSEDSGAAEVLDNKLLEQQRVLLQLQQKKIRSDYLPTLNAFANFNFQAQRDAWNFLGSGHPWYNIHYWGFSLDIPIMKGLAKKDQLQLTALQDQRLQLGIDQNQKRYLVEYEQAKSDLRYQTDALEGKRSHLELAEKLFGEADLKYREGTLMLQDFLEAESLLMEARVDYSSQLYQVKLAELNLLKITGSLDELLNQN
jgi:outer membrane protein TolC